MQTVCASGSLTKGIELGIEIAQRAEKTLGTPVLFATATTGNYGAVGWISGYDNVQALGTSQQTLAADAKFAEFVDKSVKGVYVDDPSLTQQRIYAASCNTPSSAFRGVGRVARPTPSPS